MNLLVHLEIFCGYWLLFSDFLSSSGDAERVESLVGLLDCFPWVVGCRFWLPFDTRDFAKLRPDRARDHDRGASRVSPFEF